MWRKLIAAAAILITGFLVFAQETSQPREAPPEMAAPEAQAAEAAGEQTKTISRVVYVVQPKDTLWDIAGRFLNSSYYWPKIWERNAFIIDPNLIFPGDVVNLYPQTEKLIPPPLETVPQIGEEQPQAGTTIAPSAGATAEGPPPVELKVVNDMYGKPVKISYKESPEIGWLEAGQFKGVGKIIKTRHEHGVVATYDHVWVDVGSATGAKEGDIFNVFEIAYVVRNPVTNKKVGYKILNLGEIEILKMTGSAAEAEIETSYLEMRVGDYIRPYLPPLVAEVKVFKGEKQASGYIVANRRDTPSFGQNDIVYMDVGGNQGVEPGNLLEVYLPGRTVSTNMVKRQLPDEVIGNIVVLQVTDNTSTGLVTQSSLEMKLGDKVRMAN